MADAAVGKPRQRQRLGTRLVQDQAIGLGVIGMGRDKGCRALGHDTRGRHDAAGRQINMQKQRLDRGRRCIVACPDLVEQMQLAPIAAQGMRRHRDLRPDVDLREVADMVLGGEIAEAPGDIGGIGPIISMKRSEARADTSR